MKRGVTLLELIVVIIIIGVLATLGLPNFFVVIEKSRMSEGIAVLGMVRQAQLRYASTEGDGNTTDDEGKLGLEVRNLKYFEEMNIYDVTIDEETNVIAEISRSAEVESPYGSYLLNITVGGDIACSGGIGADACSKLGFSD